MSRVLISPVTRDFSSNRYGKSYNIIRNMKSKDVQITANVGYSDTEIAEDNICINPLGKKNKLGYYISVYKNTAQQIKSQNYDIYHHMNLDYRWFNPLALFGKIPDDTPFIIGPVQSGHDILAEEFNGLVNKSVGVDLPIEVTTPILSTIERFRKFGFDPARERLMERTLRRADRIIAVHQDAKSRYSEHVDESKIDVIPLGVDPAQFEFSSRQESFDIVAIGALTRRKNYHSLLDAVEIVSDQYPQTHVHIFGDGPLRTELKNRTEEKNIENNVTFYGFVDQSILKQYLQNARLFIHPSHSESFSLVRLEAMATGCPVIISDIPGAEEMVRDGKEGYVVSKPTPRLLSDSIKKIFEDFDLTNKMSRNARERVEKKYDWSVIGQQYLQIYQEHS